MTVRANDEQLTAFSLTLVIFMNGYILNLDHVKLFQCFRLFCK